MMKKIDRVSVFIVVLYAVLFLCITYFHEPWFDEAQAWEIGRTASYREIITVLTHTEGHPPLWSLILSVPAKLNVPYLVGLKCVSFVFSMITVGLIIFLSPFPKTIRYLLPFSYFIFYQYGVISRNYCVMEFAFVLAAITFRERNKKPLRFLASLYLLCLSSAYGICIAGGICISWILDILSEYNQRDLRTLIRDKRIYGLTVLFAATLCIILLIIPPANAYALQETVKEGVISRIFYFFFVAYGDSVISMGGLPIWTDLGLIDIIPGFIVTVFIFIIVFLVSKKKDLKYFLIPYIFNAAFMSYYASGNHTGICMIWVVAYLWAVYDFKYVAERFQRFREWIDNAAGSKTSFKLSGLVMNLPVIMLAVSVLYNAKVCIDEIRLPYSESRAVTRFIKDHNMEEALIMVNWTTDDNDNQEGDNDIYQSGNTFDAVAVLPYFDENIFFNHNIKDHEKGYVSHIRLSREENEEIYGLWRECGIPEVLLGLPALDLVYGNDVSMGDYVSVASMTGYYMGKNVPLTGTQHIYVRKDCLEKFGLDNNVIDEQFKKQKTD